MLPGDRFFYIQAVVALKKKGGGTLNSACFEAYNLFSAFKDECSVGFEHLFFRFMIPTDWRTVALI